MVVRTILLSVVVVEVVVVVVAVVLALGLADVVDTIIGTEVVVTSRQCGQHWPLRRTGTLQLATGHR